MPDIGYLPATPPRSDLCGGRLARRAVMVGAIVAGAVLAGFATPADEAARAVQAAGPELTRLLRAMAGLKLLFAAALIAAAYWRVATPAGWRLASYAVAAAAMAAGPVLIWDMTHVRLGAVLLHGGLLAGTLLLWRDPVVGERLGAIVARRRAILRGRGSQA